MQGSPTPAITLTLLLLAALLTGTWYLATHFQLTAPEAAAAPEKPESKNGSRDEGLSKACMFAVEKARAAEAVLNAAEDPATSVWRADYCRWRCEVVKEQCELPHDYFDYGYRSLCPDEYVKGC